MQARTWKCMQSIENVSTSNRYWRVGTSNPQISATFVNCAFVWFFRNDSTGSTPSGCIRTSSSLPFVTWTCCTYLGIHWATYSPKSPSVFFITGFSGLIVAEKKQHSAHCIPLHRRYNTQQIPYRNIFILNNNQHLTSVTNVTLPTYILHISKNWNQQPFQYINSIVTVNRTETAVFCYLQVLSSSWCFRRKMMRCLRIVIFL